uniref:Ubiquinol-cytochrome c chaperone domain-containing protein n=1 Tax=Monodelphis domestica TaxID=13616 RepID=A0A5F8H0T4_MONDO
MDIADECTLLGGHSSNICMFQIGELGATCQRNENLRFLGLKSQNSQQNLFGGTKAFFFWTLMFFPFSLLKQLLIPSDSPKPIEEKVGALTKIIEAMGFTGPLKYSRWKIKIAALRMYTSCVEKTDFEEFFLRCQMPDTFNSWFLITLLHVWMCLVRMKQEGRSGNYMCRIIVHFMWEDVEQRGRVMGVSGPGQILHLQGFNLWFAYLRSEVSDA